jgi:adenosylhomocysteine nucleosidase
MIESSCFEPAMNDTAPHEDLSHADIGIVSALPIELGAFLDRCSRTRKYTGGQFVFRGGRYDDIRVVVVESGLGFAKARRAAHALLDAHTPPWLLSCGFAGALRPEMKIGHIVIADSIVDTHGQSLKLDVDMPADPHSGLFVGKTLTVDHMVRTIEEKQALAKQFDAIAVDMESLAVAQVARETNTRFLSIRAISDDLSRDLPPEVLSVVGSTGTLRLGAAVGSIWKRPGSVKELWQLRESANNAAEQLATFLDGVVTQLYQTLH